MNKAEYEQRKQELETRHRISVQFLQQGYEAQLRALKREWAQAAEAAPVRQPPAAHLPGGLLESVQQAMEQLPAEFKKEDVVRVLGFEPERSSLHRAMDALIVQRKIRIHFRGSGRMPNIYRKLAGDTPESP